MGSKRWQKLLIVFYTWPSLQLCTLVIALPTITIAILVALSCSFWTKVETFELKNYYILNIKHDLEGILILSLY